MSNFPPEALPFLRCPVCAAALAPAGSSLRCANEHNFDVARQGYVNLLPGDARPGTADSAEMVDAREGFLGAGYYAGLRDFVCETVERAMAVVAGEPRDAGCIVEVGAGTGYYLAAVLDRLPGWVGLALDISKFAARRAARAHARMAAVVCDAWRRLPLVDGAASLVLDVFAPRNPGEFRRILRPDGALVVITPSTRHLRELVEPLGLVTVDERKPERLEQALGAEFVPASLTGYEQVVELPVSAAAELVGMGPSARHAQGPDLLERLSLLGEAIAVTISVNATTYTPRTPADAGGV